MQNSLLSIQTHSGRVSAGTNMTHPFKKLLAAGIFVYPPLPEYMEVIDITFERKPDIVPYYYAEKPITNHNTEELSDTGELRENTRSEARSCDISWVISEQEWIMRSVLNVGGFGESDFIYTTPSIDKIADAIYNFYLGKPTIIAGWIVPLHRHPELEEKTVVESLKKAVYVSEEEFTEIDKRLLEQVMVSEPNDSWKRVLLSAFLKLPHQTNKNITCFLRRNGQNAYIVETN